MNNTLPSKIQKLIISLIQLLFLLIMLLPIHCITSFILHTQNIHDMNSLRHYQVSKRFHKDCVQACKLLLVLSKDRLCAGHIHWLIVITGMGRAMQYLNKIFRHNATNCTKLIYKTQSIINAVVLLIQCNVTYIRAHCIG